MGSEYTTLSNVEYGPFERNKMDIYLPNKEKLNLPSYGGIIFIHGGAWKFGDKFFESSNCKEYVEKGYITASINYHFIKDDFTLWDDMNDIELAIKKLDEITKKEGYNLNGIALYGTSSGAHLSMLFSYSMPEKSVIPLKFIVNKVGPSDFHGDTWNTKNNEKLGPGIALNLNGIKPYMKFSKTGKAEDIDWTQIPKEEIEEIINKVSPISHMKESSIPTLAAYAEKDKIVPIKNGLLFKSKLEELKIEHEFFLFPNSNHGLKEDFDLSDKFDYKVYDYCKKYFGY